MSAPDDTLCPECHGAYELLSVGPDRLVKRCTACGHRWNEEHEPPLSKLTWGLRPVETS
jgi:predicted Zn finger-like uncharacterized protein